MSVAPEHWQTTRPAVRERSKFIFNNDLFSDVKFVIGKNDIESGERLQSSPAGKRRKQVIPAHKLVLSIGSPVFEAMFYGKLAETSDAIELPDCDYESLLELFRYMYSDEVNLKRSNVMGVLYLAKKYMVTSLADKCIKYLERKADPTNVFSILSSAQKYEEKKLVDRCWEVIDKQTEKTVKSDEFATIERSLLETIVARDGLTIEEIDLFKAVDLWATKECDRQGLAADGSVKRRILGETLVKALRFPAMKQEDFASIVLDSKILTPDEIVTVVKCLSSVPTSPVEFPEIRRAGFKVNTERCCRFGNFTDNFLSFLLPSSCTFTLDFSVDKDITLHGVCLFGFENSSYSIDVAIIKNTKKKQVMVSKRQSGEFSSSSLRCEAGRYCGFEVMFDRGVALVKSTMYRIQAELKVLTGSLISRPSGRDHVVCSGVTFAFGNNVRERTITNLDSGQFPELLFTL